MQVPRQQVIGAITAAKKRCSKMSDEKRQELEQFYNKYLRDLSPAVNSELVGGLVAERNEAKDDASASKRTIKDAQRVLAGGSSKAPPAANAAAGAGGSKAIPANAVGGSSATPANAAGGSTNGTPDNAAGPTADNSSPQQAPKRQRVEPLLPPYQAPIQDSRLPAAVQPVAAVHDGVQGLAVAVVAAGPPAPQRGRQQAASGITAPPS